MSIQDALNQAAATLHAISGRDDVSYVRESTTLNLTKPILGASSQEVTDDNGIVIRSKAHDWLIDPTDLVISSASIEPTPGDRIVVNLGAGTETWEVQNRGADGCWRWSGPARNRMRVFVRRIPNA
jgi:hypothetical protein